jgi:hypothetical protein
MLSPLRMENEMKEKQKWWYELFESNRKQVYQVFEDGRGLICECRDLASAQQIITEHNVLGKVKDIRKRLKKCDPESLKWPDPVIELHKELWAVIDELAKAETT